MGFTELAWIAFGLGLIIVIAVPNRLRFCINQIFASLVNLPRELSNACMRYVEECPVRCKGLLKSGGIEKPPYATKCFGALFIFVVTGISIMADMDLIILTLQGINLEGGEAGIASFTGLSPSVLMAVVLMGGAAMMGMLVLERYVSGMVPDQIAKNQCLSKAFMIISGILLIGALISITLLGYVRATAVSQSDAEIVKMLENNGNATEIEQDMLPAQSFIETYLFMFISILSLVNGILGILVFPSFLMLIASACLYLLTIPAWILILVSYTADCLISLIYRIFIAGLNILTGLTKGFNRIAGKWGYFDDSVEGEETPPRSDPPIERETSEMESSGAKGDSKGQKSDGAEEDVEMLMNEIRESDDILNPYSERE